MFKKFVDKNAVKLSFVHTSKQVAKKLPFQLEACGHFSCDDSYFTERSGLKSFLIIYTLSGQGSLVYRNSEIIMEQNTCIMINCDEYHYYRTVKDSNWEFYYIHLNGICAKNYFDMLNGKGIEVIELQKNSIVKELINEIFDLSRKSSELVDLKISLSISRLLTYMLEEKQLVRKSQSTIHKDEIFRIREYIEAEFSAEIDIDSLSKQINISKFYFIKIFKDLIGQTPYDYLTDIRINTSKKLLFETDLSISEVSKTVGYHDNNNFIKLFKKRTGTTPLKFRSKAKAQLQTDLD